MHELEGFLRAEISASEAWKHVEQLARWDRMSGTPGERQAAEYIKAQLESYGVAATIYEFPSYISQPQSATLEVLAPEQWSIPCRPRAFSANTPDGGLEAPLVWVPPETDTGSQDLIFAGVSDQEDYGAIDVRGKLILSTSGTPDDVKKAQNNGAAGLIHMWPSGEDVLHEMIATPVWGTPTPESAQDLPRIPCISIKRADGERLRRLLERGEVKVRLQAQTRTFWTTLPVTIGQVDGQADDDTFLLVGGHLDSWYEGVTDNATGDACVLELARVVARNRDKLQRGVRFAWWTGHSQGRYSGSTWYADTFWEDLRYHCLGYLNIDSPGVRGAEIWDCRYNMGEVEQLVATTVRELSGREPHVRRPLRAGDQSFWGVGLPSLGAFRMLPPDHPDRAAVGGSGAGWWWHSPADTLDKADPAVLAGDAQIYATLIARICNARVLPFEFVTVAQDFRSRLVELQQAGGDALDLADLIQKAERLGEWAGQLEQVRAQLAREAGSDAAVQAVNRTLMRLSRILNPVLFTTSGDFDQDPATKRPLLPGLQNIKKLRRLDPHSNEYGFLRTRLVRERNRVAHALNMAGAEIEALLGEMGGR